MCKDLELLLLNTTGLKQSSVAPFSHSPADAVQRPQPSSGITPAGCAALCNEQMPYFPGTLCRGKDKHFPTCLVLSKWQSESTLCSRGCDACGGPSTTVGIIHKEESSVHTCGCILLITHIVCRAGHLAKRLSITCQRFM